MKTIPKAILSVDPEIQKMKDLLKSKKAVAIDSEGTLSYIDENSKSAKKAPIAPKAVLSVGQQWYEMNRDLFKMEILAMQDFKPNARYGFFNDGRMYWSGSCTPVVAGRKRRTYNFLLVYDPEHPNIRFGSSVKCYLIGPTIDDLQTIVNRNPLITEKKIPHLLVDQKNELYLCSSDRSDCSDDLSNGGITSAATSLRFAMRWMNAFELGLIDPETWGDFQLHGVI